MLRWRFFLACLLMAAIPLQGFAATAMLLCAGQAGHHALVLPAHESPHDAAAHGDHAAHDAHPEAQNADAAHGGHATHAVLAATQDGEAQDASATLSDLNHKCSQCAACCHNLALAAQPAWPAAPDARQALAHEPLVAVLTAPALLPDKPPRA